MWSTTPNYNAGPSSPPQTPTIAPSSLFKNRRNGMHFEPPYASKQNGNIIPNGNGPYFSYTPSNKPSDLSPRSSSPDSSTHDSDSDASGSPPRSLSSSPVPPFSVTPPLNQRNVIVEGNFTVEEFGESDYEEWDSDDESVIRPHQYEDAASDRAGSVRSVSRTRNEIDPRVLYGLKNLHCQPDEDDRDAWLEAMREERRRKRRSSGSVQKRTISQSIGSDTDEEDLKPVTFEGANEIGSSARRLRRKTKGERTSLIFDDPPPRIDEEYEGPDSVEELVELTQGEEEMEGGDLRELPYFRYVQDMDVDSDED
ncbi:uncharacterized protein L3040_009604 [Drepanopeziza brunnea f. sp. 'multigermtubi']|uniref:Uncharacterized protein n=1 Tax=Marssonina brunnea f. sp. multigermtubi (strain MB_m1) TaxID=1072389 RepID=K1WSZ9_MARBU|nr:uncharacterized protein MBM_05455 [Drepanopeziza brunnea f. sp. 'multigermtubi' MB_m1]EKD16161.1 hypothetical protein MBM_05455 [Drepanopeziza brunnea f. sp. 'multigermtubi' MB_m1]KAJ5033019.1 hypothetical protein L3040_009604 [Drepanopeziza brunnea f. sp. 'multigermtubi']